MRSLGEIPEVDKDCLSILGYSAGAYAASEIFACGEVKLRSVALGGLHGHGQPEEKDLDKKRLNSFDTIRAKWKDYTYRIGKHSGAPGGIYGVHHLEDKMCPWSYANQIYEIMSNRQEQLGFGRCSIQFVQTVAKRKSKSLHDYEDQVIYCADLLQHLVVKTPFPWIQAVPAPINSNSRNDWVQEACFQELLTLANETGDKQCTSNGVGRLLSARVSEPEAEPPPQHLLELPSASVLTPPVPQEISFRASSSTKNVSPQTLVRNGTTPKAASPAYTWNQFEEAQLSCELVEISEIESVQDTTATHDTAGNTVNIQAKRPLVEYAASSSSCSSDRAHSCSSSSTRSYSSHNIASERNWVRRGRHELEGPWLKQQRGHTKESLSVTHPPIPCPPRKCPRLSLSRYQSGIHSGGIQLPPHTLGSEHCTADHCWGY